MKRRRVLGLLASVPALFAAQRVLAADAVAGPVRATVRDKAITIEFDGWMRSRVSAHGAAITGFDDSETLIAPAGSSFARFLVTDVRAGRSAIDGVTGAQTVITGSSSDGLEKTVTLTPDPAHPGFVVVVTRYRNLSSAAVKIAGWRNAGHTVLPDDGGFWSFSGASYADRRDWIQPVGPAFDQRNFMGMNASDYGGGTPVADVWRRDRGLAVGHIETRPRLLALPLTRTAQGAAIAIQGDQTFDLQPGASFETPACFIAVHQGDCFAPLTAYREVMARRGLAAPQPPATAYEPTWCAWGYERNFTVAEIVGTLPKVKEIGLEWAVMDDGWQVAEGDWRPDTGKFPRGEADMIAFTKSVREAGLRPRLWLAPLAADPGSDLLHDHTDMLLLDENGAVNDVTWWNAFTLCPAYQPTIDHSVALVRKIIGEWGFAGLKLDGQHLNGVPRCFNKAHNHARPEEAAEKLQDYWKALYDAALAIDPQAVMELCPCGTSFAFHSTPYMNQTPASDPLTSWQVRLKGKTFKAILGPAAPYSGDHVELSDGGRDFASTVGIGGIVSTKFTWPRDTPNPSGTLPPGGYVLDAAKEAEWRRWIAIYNDTRLAQGRYLGDLYDIGFDRPEAHAVAKGKKQYYAFYADSFAGTVELRGLPRGVHRVRNLYSGADLGTVRGPSARLSAAFDKHLLVEVSPAGGRA